MLSQIQSKASDHIDLTHEEALWLFEQQDASVLSEIYALAARVNHELNGDVVSFIHNMNFNYTNVCELYCTFCAFRRDGDERDAYVKGPAEILEAIRGRAISEITMQGGLTEKV
ncbi:MAG: 7,8-didemethyl-8-hydroxy-5-deazariboflavin synthase subunit CofH, partial [Candidatus Omnitrophica bacterium]|nr:7,8-didemethyl-8-hydroxy-5-deazariboflavin synthase subunit CofH [Candidatus Omnitrophota bacterium]